MLKSEINSLIKNKACHDEQIDFYNKQIDSFQIVKKELNNQIDILNDELSKNKSLSEKFFKLERENRTLLENLSTLKNEIQELNFKLSNSGSETLEFKKKIR